ncbi:MAG: pyridoxamine 5'-phosphate oxidase family protein [Clostridia bacterium]|nr:pyridoxamine 5'-phosphate oxidase family protein [Clostridia bacterium]
MKRFEEVMAERFGKDSLIALATVGDGTPHVRTVNAVYRDGAFYCVTYALSGKMKQIAACPVVAVCGEWFTGHGRGENLGHILAPENEQTAEMLRRAFASWYGNGHVNEQDEHTCILRITLTDGVLMAQGERLLYP